MTAPAALYRRYRPDTFKDVIGQEHVTEPLMTALRKDRISHAYLFSGPRGCGKTTSARILARCLNCEKGPTPDPCGVCPSCVELARGGAGSLDVIEIDAASHGGVDDARDLRERATFAPVRDRYKIFIIDEAHMVTSAGFNALLKIVEEPPEHIKFIFATTEPDKVIGTIRSRTHHYPFRLVPPEPLLAYLEQLCAAENVTVAPGVLSLVIRAGGGSVRDSLSVLDQLMAGAGTDGIDYELAVALLGYTHAALLDDVVDAMAAGDSGTVFRAVDRVIQTGHDPRRFVEDLLERFRDLIIVQALPDAAESILRGVPADQLARMRVQGQNLGAAELSRAADVTNEAFNEMTGATSPRLHLELLCARLMLPAADANERGWAARVDRLERRLSFAHDGAEPAHAAQAPAAPAPAAEAPAAPAPAAELRGADGQKAPAVPERNGRQAEPRATAPVAERPTAVAAEPRATEPTPSSSGPNRVTSGPNRVTSTPQEVTSAPHGVTSAQGGGAGSVEMVRRAWPEILDALAKVKRSTWALVGPNASVAGYDGRTLALAFGTSGLASAFTRGDHSENLRKAIQDVIGVDCQIDAVTGGNGPGTAPTAGGDQRPKAPADPPPGTSVPEPGRPTPAQGPSAQAPRAQAAAPHATAGRAAQPEAAPAPAPVAAPSAADIAWGLAPAPSPTPTAEPTRSARVAEPSRASAPAVQSSPGASQPSTGAAPPALSAPSTPSSAGADAGRPAAPPAPEPSRAAAPTPASTPAPAPAAAPARRPAAEPTPYDDIPYSDEEPPSDWDAPYPEDEGYAPSRSRSTAPDHSAAPSAPEAAGTATPGPTKTSAGDPWSYAKETSPGVWTVGTEPNLRSGGAQAPAEARPTAEPDPAPSYAPAAAQPPQSSPPSAPSPAPASPAGSGRGDGGRKLSMYERLSRSAAAQQSVQQQSAQQPPAQGAPQYVEEIPSADDETIEGSSLFGRAAVERILGGKLIEERSLDGAPLPPR
ncbi:DNA polymerase III subunit gamma and tau [Sinomonas sp. R1AF57]|uniref:DNA polymerase III subunit gamma and tau n=1 Tax=Sinomonas sp. R1AF57 TaxID=2020377 RepID=UPI000B5EA7C6|nr:DNA polymerase III subunit gamma and tau [Sinomonas sp. R1AF57]ASN50905.1 AAA family ATPase [Sinomonas sp. R1AF57]